MSLLAVGDTVSEDEVVCEIETDKVRSFDETPLKQWGATNNCFNNWLIIFFMPVHSNNVHNWNLYATKLLYKKYAI